MLTYYDALLAPLYFILILILLIRWKRKHYSNTLIGKYIIPCFILKSFCCIFLALVFNFYYGGGDMFTYFKFSQEIWNATKANPLLGLELIFKPLENCSLEAQKYAEQLATVSQPYSSTFLIRIAGFLSMFCFGTYLPIALFFSLLAFLGTWKIFLVFYNQYPTFYKPIALGCLFAPSALLWGTNLLKDPLCMFALGLCVSGMYAIIKKKMKIMHIAEIFIGAAILSIVKDYLFYILIAATIITLIVLFKSRNVLINITFRLLTFVVIIAGTSWIYLNIGKVGESVYTNFTSSTQTIQNVQASLIEEGASGYILPGINDFSAAGIFRTYLLSINVALFRPYLWEVTNPLMLLSALESFLILLLFVYLLIKTKFTGFFKFAVQNPVVFFALLFSLLLAPLAGFVSFNFGTLARYKFPMVPFLYTYLLVLYADLKQKKLNLPNSIKP